MLNTSFDKKGGELTVKLEGRLDALTSQQFEKDMEAAMDDVTAVVMDISDLAYISSAGLRTILATQQYMEEHDYSNVKVVGANEGIMEIFEETGFTELIEIE